MSFDLMKVVSRLTRFPQSPRDRVFVESSEARRRLIGLNAHVERGAQALVSGAIWLSLVLILTAATGYMHVRAIRLCLPGDALAETARSTSDFEPTALVIFIAAGVVGAVVALVYYGVTSLGLHFWSWCVTELPEDALVEPLHLYLSRQPQSFLAVNGAIVLFGYPLAGAIVTRLVWGLFLSQQFHWLCLICNLGMFSLVHTLFLPMLWARLPDAPEPAPPPVFREWVRGVRLGSYAQALLSLGARRSNAHSAPARVADPHDDPPQPVRVRRKSTYEEAEEIASRIDPYQREH